jgi:STAS domain
LICRCRSDEEDDVTLRITREEGSRSRALLRLEGSVVAECAALLERECLSVLRSGGAVSLDLVGVNFVDRAGVEALEWLSRAGVEIRCRSGPVASVLEGEGVRLTRDADDVNDGWP